MKSRIVTGLALALGIVFGLSACGGSFRTYYERPVSTAVSAGWHVTDIRVAVPESLSVSEQKSVFPIADIVWREDPPGDRREQVGAIVANAAKIGAEGLKGRRAVRLEIVLQRFHALTFEAESRLSSAGVHNIDFNMRVVDVASGEVLAGPAPVEAALPALAGAEMVAARVRGETQKSQITEHLVKVFKGWLGVGPDPRGSFTRIGG